MMPRSPNTHTMTRSSLVKCLVLTAGLSFCLGSQLSNQTGNQGRAQEDFLSNRKFTREETMLLNMTHQKGSVGFLLLESVRNAKESTRNIEKALFQLREIEKSYAKSKGKPDTRYLSNTELKMVHAKQVSEDLESLNSDCFHDLKASIKETLTEKLISH